MGGQQSGEGVNMSPLGCILAHWKNTGGPQGGSARERVKEVLVGLIA